MSMKNQHDFPKLIVRGATIYGHTGEVMRDASAAAAASGGGEATMTATELNHALFERQMEHLRGAGAGESYFAGTELHGALVGWMREAAEVSLVSHGLDPDVAARKAAHELIFWASVHDGDSVHEPHVTEDALLGGVYPSAYKLSHLRPLITCKTP